MRIRVAVAMLAGIWLLVCAACRRSDAPPGDSWLEHLSGGIFLAQGRWIDFRQRYREEERISSILPPVRLATVAGGWGGTESWGGWGLGKRTELNFFLRWPGTYDFDLVCRSADLPGGRPQAVTVTINGREIAGFEVAAGWERLRFEVPGGVLQRGENRVELTYGSYLVGDAKRDARPLALAIERVGLVADGQRSGNRGAAFGIETDAEADALRLTASGTYLIPARLPPESEALELTPLASRRATRWRATVMTLDGGEDTLLEDAAGRQRMDLREYRGREVVLVFDADLPRGGFLELSSPRLLTGVGSAPEPPASKPVGRPNVVMVVLDAARADHFGLYGYGRETTPNIDRLAAQSLVFSDAVAECPFTACSMPGLLTGLSFRRHGVTSRQQRLADETETLAEALSALGYQTLGFSGNPNSSRAMGADQGFDEFYEIWRLASGRDRTHPDFLNATVSERLARGLDDRPLFLLVHYVPPHEPYDPDPRFDVFGDSGYVGPVTGEQRFVQSVFARAVELDAADLAELIALYDGNLLMADHAVGRLIEILEEAGRWDDTIFVLTSDHGEAFGEHGFVGHNDSIYEEMLRVPLILRLPGSERPTGIGVDRLAKPGDLVPTLRGRLGQPMPAAAAGIDLLAPAPAVDERLLFLRSAHEEGVIFGVRTPRWKLMSRERGSGGGWHRLFDLDADPRERSDIAAERRLLHAALALRLERWLRGTPEPSLGTPAAPISPEDEAMLRSLGYL